MGKLDGKVVIVTGSSRGIGAEIARLFGAEGGKVVCVARTLKEGEHQFEGSLETTVQRIKDAGGEATAVAANISDPEECQKIVNAAHDAYGPVDILINNAALTYFIPVKDYPLNRWMRSWAVNFHAPFVLCQLVLPDMIEKKSGAIINISSAAAIGPGSAPYQTDLMTTGGGTCYGAEKAALERFTQGLAAEVFQYGITVACFSPSQVVPTPGTVHHHLVRGLDDPAGEPPEYMAKAALILATEPQEKVTGRVTYSQVLLKEYGQIDKAQGAGVDFPGTGFSRI
jgi:NAD(P)-dependent dehydrogenase (short-subunit alcohol dehydrogenase family)